MWGGGGGGHRTNMPQKQYYRPEILISPIHVLPSHRGLAVISFVLHRTNLLYTFNMILILLWVYISISIV